MRGFFKSAALFALGFLLVANTAKAETFLQRCFPKADFLKSKVECVLSRSSGDLHFVLTGGTQINVSGLSQFGQINKSFKIERVTHLQPRLTDAGPMDESIRFMGTSFTGSYVASINFGCEQTFFALVGFDKTNQPLKDHTARCQILPLK